MFCWYYPEDDPHWTLGRKNDAIATAEEAGIGDLAKFYKEGQNDEMTFGVAMKYKEITDRGEYVSPFIIGVDYAVFDSDLNSFMGRVGFYYTTLS